MKGVFAAVVLLLLFAFLSLGGCGRHWYGGPYGPGHYRGCGYYGGY